MINPQDDRHRRPEHSDRAAGLRRLWPTYLGITGLLLAMLVGLAGGIIWYNSTKSDELAVAAATRLMQEAEDKIIGRIALLYDPMYAIVGVASLVPQLTSPSIDQDPRATDLLLRALRFYPQIESLFVGFDNGDFYMVTHITGDRSAGLRAALQSPGHAAFAVEKVVAGAAGGERAAQWTFIAADGTVVLRRDPVPNPFDPRERVWYAAAKGSDAVAESGLYIFASSGEVGFTLSRSFGGATPGVMGADFAAVDLASFLRGQKITPSSTAFIFTGSGGVVAVPDPGLLAAQPARAEAMAPLPKIADLQDPVIKGLVAAYQNGRMAGTRVYDVAGRGYIGRVVAIPPRYGRDQLLAIMVPIDEIEEPVEGIRNETLLYSIAFVLFALPLFVTLVTAWIDRRLGNRTVWQQFRDDE
jgi:adenylate cyclase